MQRKQYAGPVLTERRETPFALGKSYICKDKSVLNSNDEVDFSRANKNGEEYHATQTHTTILTLTGSGKTALKIK